MWTSTGIQPGVLEDLMSTIQAQSEALQGHSQVISHLINERSSGNPERLSSIPEGTKIHSNSALDDEFRRVSLGTTLQSFSFPASEDLMENAPSSPTSRASSFSISSASMPPSPATSHSSMASFSTLTEDRRSSYTTSRHSSCSSSNPVPLSSSRPRSFNNGSFPSANIGRRVSFGSPSSKVVLHQSANRTKREAAELFEEKALAASLPNKYRGSRGSLPRNKSFPTPGLPRRSPERSPEDSLPLSIRIEHRTEYHRPPLSSKGSPPRSPPKSPESVQRASIGSRASSYTSQIKNRQLQPVLPPKIHQRPLDIPSKEQWRSSLKSARISTSPPSPPSPPSSIHALSDTSGTSPRQSHSSPTSGLQLAPRQAPKSNSNTFTTILTQNNLLELQRHLNNISIQQITHYASTWSYNQTLSQFLHPDHFYLKEIDLVHRSYL